MERMKAAKLRELTTEELTQQCVEMQRELFNLRMQQSAARVEQPSRFRQLRRDIARARTIMAERGREQGA